MADEEYKKLQPEPQVEHEDGTISDWEEHVPMLMNPEAVALADELAAEQARAIGLSEEFIKKYMTGPEIVPPRTK